MAKNMPYNAQILPNNERRLTSCLIRFWQDACRGRLMPDEADLDPDALADLWPKCFLIQTFDIKREHYSYTYLGEEIIEAFQDGMMDEGQSMLVSPKANKLALSFNQVITTCAPVISEGEFLSLAGRMIRYRQCLLPLGKGEEVLAIFGGLSLKAY